MLRQLSRLFVLASIISLLGGTPSLSRRFDDPERLQPLHRKAADWFKQLITSAKASDSEAQEEQAPLTLQRSDLLVVLPNSLSR